MKLKNDVVILEVGISDDLLRNVKDLKAEHPDKEIAIKYCAGLLKENYPDIEIFEIGPNYLITETRMYIAIFEDEIEVI